MAKTGLIVGKFCPLHKGHEYLIESALKACDHLVIISYAKPGYLGCETAKRKQWLESLYPQTTRLVIDDKWLTSNPSPHWPEVPHDDAPVDIHREFTAWACYHVLGKFPDTAFPSEDFGDGFAAFLRQNLTKVSDEKKSVEHICMDKARSKIPISGTRIHSDPLKHREFLSGVVSTSFVRRAVLLGGESTGKTTLCAAVAKRLSTQWAAEYGRELWDKKEATFPMRIYCTLRRCRLNEKKLWQ